MDTLRKIKTAYDKCEEYLICFFLVATTLLVFYQVCMRYLFNNSPAWSEEIARFMFVWESWLGVSLTQKYSKHIKIEAIVSKLKGMKLHVCTLIGDLLTLAVCVLLVVYGFRVTELIFQLGQSSSGAHVPLWIVYLACPFSCFMMSIRLVLDMRTQIRNISILRGKELA